MLAVDHVVIADVDWSALTPAAAFVLGTILATVAVLRVVRYVFTIRRDETEKDRQ